MQKTKILLTGAGGFCLTNFTRHVLKNYSNYSVVGIDRCDKAITLNTLYKNKDHNFYLADITDEKIIDRIFQVEQPDYVIHGAWSNKGGSKDLIYNNIYGIEVIVEACEKYNVKKLLHLSSGEVYGNLGSVDTEPSKETSELKYGGQVGTYKIAAEAFIKNSGSKLNYNIIRLPQVYGNWQLRESYIPKVVYSLLNNIELYENGMNVSDWLHIEDCSSAILHILEKGERKDIYNVSSRQEFTNIEVFYEISKALEKNIEFKNNYDIF